MLKRDNAESLKQNPLKAGTAKPPVRPAVPDRPRSLAMAARIYRASIGAFSRPLEEVQNSDDFRKFIALTGMAVAPLTPLFDVEHYLAKVAGPLRGSMNPVLHFSTYGPFTGFSPTWLFDEPYIRQSLATLGQPAGRKGDADLSAPADPQRSDVVELFVAILENVEPPYIHPHPLFDPDLWASSAPTRLAVHPAVDFVTTRNVGRRCFSPYFSVPCYGHTRPHIRAGNINPLFLYLTNCAAGKVDDVNPMFHSLYVKYQHKIAATDVLSYYLTEGIELDIPPNPFAESELRISDADRLSGDLPRLYLDYLRCEADLEASRDLAAAPLFGKGAADARDSKWVSYRPKSGEPATPEVAEAPSRPTQTPDPFAGPEESFPLDRDVTVPAPELSAATVSERLEEVPAGDPETHPPSPAEAGSTSANIPDVESGEQTAVPSAESELEPSLPAVEAGLAEQPPEQAYPVQSPEEHALTEVEETGHETAPADGNSPNEEEAII